MCDHLSSRKRVVCIRDHRGASCKSDQIYIRASWTTSLRKSSCKYFVDDYNATPPLEGRIVRKKKLKSALGFGCVGGLLALINISRTVPEINLLRNKDSKVNEQLQ